MSEKRIDVAVGIIVSSDNKILISKRSADVHQANRWEFPGGKLELNEDPKSALYRELKEELGITIASSELLKTINFDYDDKRVCLHTYLVSQFEGEAKGLEQQPIKWVDSTDFVNYQFPDANAPIINLLSLPDWIQITGEFSTSEELLVKSEKCLDAGVRLLQFRAHELADEQYVSYAQSLLGLCHQYNAKLVLNRNVDVLNRVDADGIHLNRFEALKYTSRPFDLGKLLSVSCHNINELKHAELLSADYCLLSPVKKAISHDAGEALGMTKFANLSKLVRLPVYALGGMGLSDVITVKESGGRGVATISASWL